jgi:hypothetical protein
MATIKQKTAFKNMVELVGNKQTPSMAQVMKGIYSPAVISNPSKLTKSKGWNELLAQIKDEPLLERLRELALDRTDKRAALTAIDMLLDLKDRYPANKSINVELEKKINDITVIVD